MDDSELTSLQASFEAKLDELEQTLAKYPGYYFLSTFSLADIFKNSGVQALANNGDTAAVKAAIEAHLKLLAEYLLKGDQTQLPLGRVGGKDNLDPFSAAVGAVTLAYVRNRICAPRDMSAGAATAFRAAADKVLASIY